MAWQNPEAGLQVRAGRGLITRMPRAEPSPDLPPLERLLAITARLRDPDDGCPWDRQQTFATIAPYTVEEAYEVADAVERGDLDHLKEELGDLLLQVVFHARVAEESGAFDFDDVARAINDKMVRRHPHVFAEARYASVTEQKADWDAFKAEERVARGRATSLLDDVPLGLPGLTRAVKLSRRAATVGFVWPTVQAVVAKLHEEVGELITEIDTGNLAKTRDEIGDVLFVVANLARSLDIDPEDALRGTNAKFSRRFRHIERRLAESGLTPEQSNLADMDALWDEAKAVERDQAVSNIG